MSWMVSDGFLFVRCWIRNILEIYETYPAG